PSYSLFKPLSPTNPSTVLVKRLPDGETLLAHPLHHLNTESHPHAPELLRRGAGVAASNILNHENLVNVHQYLTSHVLHGTTSTEGVDLLWDWCDAGTLQDVFNAYPSPLPTDSTSEDGHLPESLVWHVGLGMLRALQWLHEGIREEYDVVPAPEPRNDPYGCVRADRRTTTLGEDDWLPVLHRDIRPGNIHLQQPRGFETYGLAKLGGFEKAWVSGTVSKESGTPLVGPMPPRDVTKEDAGAGTLTVLRERLAAWRSLGRRMMPREERPYTVGSELFALGAVLYRMMTGRELASGDECEVCGCFHVIADHGRDYHECQHVDCPFEDVVVERLFGRLEYTSGLKDLVIRLLGVDRSEKVSANGMLGNCWDSYKWWAEQTDEGLLFRDIYNDIWIRWRNDERRKRAIRVATRDVEDLEE
ncbi:hypothetical protein B0T17DRAFT_461121, partial [Bombardia bombarda]